MQNSPNVARRYGGHVLTLLASLVLALTLQSSASAATSTDGSAGAGANQATDPLARSAGGAKIGRHFFGLHAPSLASSFPKTKVVGALNLTTNGVYWPSIETSRGHFNFARLDLLVKKSRAHHAKPLLVLGQTPKFHSTHPGSLYVRATVPKLAPWKRYVAHVANRYGARLDYEIWPEPNSSANWTGSPKKMATLVAAAAKIIHRKAPSATVVSPAFVLRWPGQRAWMSNFFAARVGGKRIGSYVDAVGINAYALEAGTPEDSVTLIKLARKILHTHRVSAPLWTVEINYGVKGGGQPIDHHSSARKQASYVVRTYVLNAASKVRRVYWLGWFGKFTTMDVQLTRPDGVTKTKAGKAYGLVRHWLLGQRVRACKRNARTHVYTCTTVRSGHTSYIYWATSGKRVVRAPAGVRRLQTTGGKVSRTHKGKRISVTSAPVRAYH